MKNMQLLTFLIGIFVGLGKARIFAYTFIIEYSSFKGFLVYEDF
jgi:hypothetical protein